VHRNFDFAAAWADVGAIDIGSATTDRWR
jgi:hypothetical protein